ncbi:pentatricopeptide repeat-containing protein, putative [Perkinsus marinus ATCC 50983]|uniref:tRNA (guanine(46)-N(7))-methyltransferase n=1 Tax=Perkinsus marinus (strain ATCC 50983 / TXsc) TaxID=423536 RepID=C5M1A5_PERM5|nr:pentatricopeptide repeat-containing protein, putative [Perkinsus marinus ATCC 50983]EEQ97227.1 pentatricopeptide repeat-containing protein, putative [Perkinsus marinus ATCC 50983]|eukprot:XP_002764510.1 pentatricopeptide repeat-containing protein, putative [Perkinsus marinus ATCC 50983]
MKIRFGLIQKLASGEKINKIGQGKKNKKNQQKRDKKVDVMPFNKKLTRAAERKELVTALGIMDSIKKAGGRPDKHTYANIINVCVRCDDITKAEEFLAEMRDSVGPSVVPMTTMLKGYASEGMRDKAVELLEEMMKTKIANGRSVSAFLRGCLRHGWYEAAVAAYKKASEKGILEDGCRNIYARILSLAGRSSEAIALEGLTGSTLASIATTMAITSGADKEAADAAIKRAEGKLSEEEKRADGLKNKFGDHLIAEARRDLNAAKKFLASDTSVNIKPSFARFLYLPKSTENDSIEQRILQGWKGIGIEQVVDNVEEFAANMMPKMLNNGKLKITDDDRGVCLEVGSGSGDWVLSRAKRDWSQQWIAAEFKFDRCASIRQKCLLEGPRNVHIIGGDARECLPMLLPLSCVSEVHINFPEPPVWHDACAREDKSYRNLIDSRRSQRRGQLYMLACGFCCILIIALTVLLLILLFGRSHL